MNRITIITAAGILSALTTVMIGLALIIPWFYLLFPVILPLIMGLSFYHLRGMGYLFYGLAVLLIGFIFSWSGLDTLFYYLFPSLLLGGAWGWMLKVRLGWLDMLILLPFIQMGLMGISLWLMTIILDVDGFTILHDVFPTSSSIFLLLYGMSLLTCTLLIWWAYEDQSRLRIQLTMTRFNPRHLILALWIGNALLILSMFFFVDFAALLFTPLLWVSITLSSHLMTFKTSNLTLVFLYGWVVIFLLVALNTLFPNRQVWLLLPIFFIPWINVESIKID